MRTSLRSALKYLVLAGFLPLVACSAEPTSTSQPFVTDVDHTVVKRQSIGNCWLYAHATWLESLLKVQTGESLDVSESYWTWWHWYHQIVGSSISEIQTGGYWGTSANIILNYGWVKEGEFIESEDGVEMSYRQSQALSYMNQQLQPGGALASRTQRTAARVREQLDIAYGTDMAEAQSIARSANSTIVDTDANGSVTLAQALNGGASRKWKSVSFPRLYGQDVVPTVAQEQQRKNLMKRIYKALNAKEPVVMSLMIDFNAQDRLDQGSFKKELVDARGPGSQGGHMVVLEDYTVDNVPGYGSLGEGELSAEEKAAAVNGDLNYLVSKNSWGANRPDRGLTDGYTRFYSDYLFSNLAWKWSADSTPDQVSYYTTLTDFVLPPGF